MGTLESTFNEFIWIIFMLRYCMVPHFGYGQFNGSPQCPIDLCWVSPESLFYDKGNWIFTARALLLAHCSNSFGWYKCQFWLIACDFFVNMISICCKLFWPSNSHGFYQVCFLRQTKALFFLFHLCWYQGIASYPDILHVWFIQVWMKKMSSWHMCGSKCLCRSGWYSLCTLKITCSMKLWFFLSKCS